MIKDNVGGNKINSKKSDIRINKAITAREVRLVDPDNVLDPRILGPGDHTGVLSKGDAQRIANLLGLDLVEVSPNTNPPVVRVMDYGKYLFGLKKTKKKQKVQKLKEIKLRPVTDEGDYQVKLRNLLSFLEDGDKVKITIRFKGREITHKDLGQKLIDRLKLDLQETGIIDQEPKFEGRQIIMVVSPKSKR